jgi:predicted metal-dependent hydrolase
MSLAPSVTVRNVSFPYPPDFDPAWSGNVPEFACAANSVSLMMPYVEPYLARSVRAALPQIEDPELRREAAAYVRQELTHHVQHRQFNDLLAERCRGIHMLERWMRAAFERLGRRKSLGSHLAFAAGAEGVAYGAARWAAAHRRELLATAEPAIAELFLWHLAEEVEHKSVAFDVFQAVDGSRRRYVWGMLLGFALLAFFTVVGTTVQLWQQRRLFHPIAYVRLTRWSVTFLFELLPAMAISSFRGHHPRDLADPPFLVQLLRERDAA